MTKTGATPPTTMPWAARQQDETDEFDEWLTRDAQKRHPRAQWWWGNKADGVRNGAWCWVCDTWIATWDRRWAMTRAAKDAVMLHRRDHQNDLV
jgi:hypothetical protein